MVNIYQYLLLRLEVLHLPVKGVFTTGIESQKQKKNNANIIPS